jgi:hypothetical protein
MRPGGKWSVTATPEVSPPGGAIARGTKVRLYCSTEGASIAYTTEPGNQATWKLYAGEFPLVEGATLRAKACRLGWRDSEETSATFRVG